jgi:hypothetical protein
MNFTTNETAGNPNPNGSMISNTKASPFKSSQNVMQKK